MRLYSNMVVTNHPPKRDTLIRHSTRNTSKAGSTMSARLWASARGQRHLEHNPTPSRGQSHPPNRESAPGSQTPAPPSPLLLLLASPFGGRVCKAAGMPWGTGLVHKPHPFRSHPCLCTPAASKGSSHQLHAPHSPKVSLGLFMHCSLYRRVSWNLTSSVSCPVGRERT
jgi:hypothetical protein